LTLVILLGILVFLVSVLSNLYASSSEMRFLPDTRSVATTVATTNPQARKMRLRQLAAFALEPVPSNNEHKHLKTGQTSLARKA
jgi:hypothetical protein